MLNILSEYYEEIPPVPSSGSFEQQTKESVIAFQRLYNLPENGIVGDRTWELMYNAVKGIYIVQDISTPTPPVEILPYPGSILSVGAQGETVMALQEYLNEISLVYPEITPITPTGSFGNNTTTAVTEFQRLFNLPDTGVVDRATWEEIERIFIQIREGALPAFGQYPGYELKEGQIDRVRGIETNTDNLVGRPVYSLQHMLRFINAEKDLPGIPDGIFGSQTTDRVKTFQTENNITPTGTVDSLTFRAIRNAYNQKTDSMQKPQNTLDQSTWNTLTRISNEIKA